jgi:CDP-diacylglycerol--serine O-phosphatidyltransferase
MSSGTTKIRRGVYLLPNALTTGALFAGFFSIISGINGRFTSAAVAVLVAALLDALDGRVARLTHTETDFGVQYDSLSDLISFGLAPALLTFNWSLASLGGSGSLAGKLGWLAAFVFVACAALRLARFNTQAHVADKRYFQGLATPAAAVTLVATVWFLIGQGISGESVRWLMWLETVFLGLLMFSRVRYVSGKGWPHGDRIPAGWLFAIVLIIVLLAIDPPAVLMLVGLAYVFSGLVITVLGRRQWRLRRLRRLRRRNGRGELDEEDENRDESDDETKS